MFKKILISAFILLCNQSYAAEIIDVRKKPASGKIDVRTPPLVAKEDSQHIAKTNEPIVLKGLTIGMSQKQVLEMFPLHTNEEMIHPEENSNVWIAADSVITYKTCEQFSLLRGIPNECELYFFDDKLSKVMFNVGDSKASYIEDEAYFKELKNALSERFKSNAKCQSEQANVFVGVMTEYVCSWENSSRGESLQLIGRKFNGQGQATFESKVVMLKQDYVNRVNKRIAATAQKIQQKEDAERNKRKADL